MKKIAIHNREGSFSDKWVEYCKKENIPYEIVNCYDNDIINKLEGCDLLMWHYHHENYKDVLFAKTLLYSLEQSGKKVFPNFKTGWFFDDKVGQKYLLEAIGAPLVKSYVFYSRREALDWIKTAIFPKVFKLRRGAGAANVKLIKNRYEAAQIIKKGFKKGFKHCDYKGLAVDALKKYIKKKGSLRDILKYVALYLFPSKYGVDFFREKGYVYFQDFLEDNFYDVRLIVIKNRAYGMKRLVRENDFRASGSEEFIYDKIDEKTLSIAFDIAKKLNLQSVAFDFIYKGREPFIVEMSCFYGTKGSSKCLGYWTDDLKWHEERFNPFGWIIENILNE